MTKTSDFGSGKREGHDASSFYASAMMQDLKAQTQGGADGAVGAVGPWADQIYCKSSTEMTEIPDRSVGLVFTSPPYNVQKNYSGNGAVDKGQPDGLSLQAYFDLIEAVGKEVWRVLVPGGRYVINVANVGRTPYFPMTQEFWARHREIGFLPAGEVIWQKGKGASGSCAWGCYDDKTRVMTKEGFKFFRDVDIAVDQFATMNTQTGCMEWQYAFDYIAKPYTGDMVSIKHRSVNLVVTPNHQMLVRHGDGFRLVDADKLVNGAKLPRRHNGLIDDVGDAATFVLNGVERHAKSISGVDDDVAIEMDDWLAFLGIYLTDGNVTFNERSRSYIVDIYQTKPDVCAEIVALLEHMPFKYSRDEKKQRFRVCDKRLAFYLSQFGGKNERTLPSFINDISVRQKRLFVEWVWRGDGSVNRKIDKHTGRMTQISVPSKKFADSLRILLIEIGEVASQYVDLPQKEYGRILCGKEVVATRSLHRLAILTSASAYVNAKRESRAKIIHYDGIVYCVSVPNRTLLVEREGISIWCGNSWRSAKNPRLRDLHEYLLVMTKGMYGRPDRGESTMNVEEFMASTLSIWQIPPESAKRIGHPAPFPVALAERVINLWSYKDDVVLDPFAGAGTTAVAAVQRGRHYVGYDIAEEYVALAATRISKAVYQPVLK